MKILALFHVANEYNSIAFFLAQVSNSLLGRVGSAERSFNKDMEFEARVSSDFELSLDYETVLNAIEALNFLQMKGASPSHCLIIPLLQFLTPPRSIILPRNKYAGLSSLFTLHHSRIS
jgi:hypothetical protein